MENLKTKIEKWKKNKGKKTNGKMVKVEKTVGLHDGVPFNLKVKLGRKHIQNAGGIKERERGRSGETGSKNGRRKGCLLLARNMLCAIALGAMCDARCTK